MRIRIIEPEGEFFNEEGTFLEFTTINGRMGVYEDQIPLTTILEPCVVKIHQGSEVKKAAVLGGFVEIEKKQITMLAEDANWPDEIDVERAKAAKQRAEEAFQQSKKAEKKEDVLRLVEAQIAGCVDLSPEEMVDAAFLIVERIDSKIYGEE